MRKVIIKPTKVYPNQKLKHTFASIPRSPYTTHMKSYWLVFTNNLQRAFIYRSRLLTYAFNGTFAPIMMLIILHKLYANGETVKGFTLEELATYYSAAIIASLFVSMAHENVKEDIIDGELSNFVIKPFNYFIYRFFWEGAWWVIKGILFLIPFGVFIYISNIELSFNLSILGILQSVVTIFFSYLLSYTFSMIIGTVAFYLTEITGVTNSYRVIIEIVSGKLFPLAFLPLLVQQAIEYTPFYYYVYFPVQTLMGNYSLNEYLFRMLVLIAWIAAGITIYSLTWKNGIKKFSAVGL